MCVIIFIILGRPSLAHKFLIWMQIRSSTTNSNGYRTTVVLLLVTAGCDGHSVPLQVWSFYLSFELRPKFSLAPHTRVGTLIVATIYLQLMQSRCMFRSFTVLQCSHQHCVQPVVSDVEVVGYL